MHWIWSLLVVIHGFSLILRELVAISLVFLPLPLFCSVSIFFAFGNGKAAIDVRLSCKAIRPELVVVLKFHFPFPNSNVALHHGVRFIFSVLSGCYLGLLLDFQVCFWPDFPSPLASVYFRFYAWFMMARFPSCPVAFVLFQFCLPPSPVARFSLLMVVWYALSWPGCL